MIGLLAEKQLDNLKVWIWTNKRQLQGSEFVHLRLESRALAKEAVGSLNRLHINHARINSVQQIDKHLLVSPVGCSANDVASDGVLAPARQTDVADFGEAATCGNQLFDGLNVSGASCLDNKRRLPIQGVAIFVLRKRRHLDGWSAQIDTLLNENLNDVWLFRVDRGLKKKKQVLGTIKISNFVLRREIACCHVPIEAVVHQPPD